MCIYTGDTLEWRESDLWPAPADNTVAASMLGIIVAVLAFDSAGYALVQHLSGEPTWITLEHTRVTVQS